MDLNIIKNNLTDKRYNLIYEETVSSTNVVLKELALKGEKEFTVLIADSQTSGIGRKGNSFFSPKQTGIYMSVLLRPSLSIKDSLLITPMAAACCARAIENVTPHTAQIKWVNDIYVDNKKVCGILTQSCVGNENSLDSCILGIGINVFSPRNDFPDDIKNKAGYICDKAEKDLREKLIAEVLNELSTYYNNIIEKSFYEEYCARSMLTNKMVTVIYPNRKINATVIGIDKDFHLIVRLSDGTITALDSGEVSLQITPDK